MIVRFDDCELDLGRVQLRRADHAVPVEPQVFDVLEYLLRHRDRVVSKEELLDEVWGDRFVSESALTSRIKSVRRAVGDDGRTQSVIRTVHGRGYQFVAHVELEGGDAPSTDQSTVPVAAEITAPPVSFGRDELVAEVGGWIDRARVVSLVGPAGVGKTHLARNVGSRVDGAAWFVRLAEVRDPDDVADAVLDGLGRRRLPDRSALDSVVSVLANAPGLLVLDNCEHVLDAVAELIRACLSTGSPVSVLATSRQRLGVAGEQVVPVAVLDADAAAELVVARIGAAGGRVAADDPDVRTICDRLDRLPLALELAGARARVLGADAVVALLDQRWELLRAGGEVDRHHATLQQAIAASVESLDRTVRRTLAALTVFAGPFDLDAATTVAGPSIGLSEMEVVDNVVDLVERSLLQIEDGRPARYRMLESVRIYASDHMRDLDVVRSAHLSLFRDRAAARRIQLDGPELESAMVDAAREWADVRVAVGNAISQGRSDDLAGLLAATAEYAELTQRLEHVDWSRRCLAAASGTEAELPRVRGGLARLLVLEDLAEAVALTEAAGEPADDADLSIAASWCGFMTGDHESGLRHLHIADEARRGTRGLGELYVLGLACFHLTRSRLDPGEHVRRMRRATRDGGPVAGAFAAWASACGALADRDTDRVLAEIDELLGRAEATGLELLSLVGLRMRAVALAGDPDHARVASALVDAMTFYRERGRWTSVLSDSPMAARLLVETGRYRPAIRILASHRPHGSVGGWSTTLSDQLRARIVAAEPALDAVDSAAVWSPQQLADEVIDELRDLLDDS
ncbi:MAG: winged helix-turn-helix domain-containing protein [Actinomycetota bacterium]